MEAKQEQEKSEKSSENYKNIIWILIILSGLILIFAFCAPYILVLKSSIGKFNCSSNELGDTIGGLMTPFIATAGVILTFLAFYLQYKANEDQKDRLNTELEKQKKEKNVQELKIHKNEIENRFYEMLRIHRDNINEISIVAFTSSNPATFNTYKGREVFKFFIDEFDFYYFLADTLVEKGKYDKNINESFAVFYLGTYKNANETYFGIIKNLKSKNCNLDEIRFLIYDNKDIPDKENFLQYTIDFINKQKFPICNGKYSILGTYFRHLFQTVEYVVNQSESIFSYEEKRNLIKILRSQLSTDEQMLIYLHWKSRFGYTWENGENNFFTDYRLLFNIAQLHTFFKIDLDELKKKDYRKVINHSSDPLFESEEWSEANPDFK